MKTKKTNHLVPHLKNYLFTGILTVIPIWITWLVFGFIFKYLSKIGMPWVGAFSIGLRQTWPAMAEWIVAPWFQSAMSVMMTLVSLYVLGWITTLVIGKRLLRLVDMLMDRIPLVQTIYGGVKKLVAAMQQNPDRVQRVVLIPFPTPEMKTVGFVTKVLRDHETGQPLAVVYVPTTPNPTSGYIEIVPLDKVTSTNWTIDEAMSFIISGGVLAPDEISYFKGVMHGKFEDSE